MADFLKPISGPLLAVAPVVSAPPRSAPVAEPAPAPPPGVTAAKGQDLPQTKHAGSAAALESAVKDIQQNLKTLSPELKFHVDKSTGQVVFQIIQPSTGEVIRQVPSEQVLATAQKLRELSGQKDTAGVLMDEKG